MKNILISIIVVLSLATIISAQEISKSDWIKYMQNALPGIFCQQDQYFRQCFNTTGSDCLQIMREASIECLNKEQKNLPATLTSQTGEQWGNIIGTCVGAKYEQKLQNKKSKAPNCYNPSHWMK
jgi:hypothetical protein